MNTSASHPVPGVGNTGVEAAGPFAMQFINRHAVCLLNPCLTLLQGKVAKTRVR
jgi:hypothetical protein